MYKYNNFHCMCRIVESINDDCWILTLNVNEKVGAHKGEYDHRYWQCAVWYHFSDFSMQEWAVKKEINIKKADSSKQKNLYECLYIQKRFLIPLYFR